MDQSGIVMGKHDASKRARARQFRREMTAAEACLWQHLRSNRLQGWHFRRQQIIDGFIADFYCHEAGLIIEADGKVHENQGDYDRLRDQLIATRQVQILRFSNERILNEIQSVLAEIQAVLARRKQ